MNGIAVTRLAMTQTDATIRKPSRSRNSYSALRTGYQRINPARPISRKLSKKALRLASPIKCGDDHRRQRDQRTERHDAAEDALHGLQALAHLKSRPGTAR